MVKRKLRKRKFGMSRLDIPEDGIQDPFDEYTQEEQYDRMNLQEMESPSDSDYDSEYDSDSKELLRIDKELREIAAKKDDFVIPDEYLVDETPIELIDSAEDLINDEKLEELQYVFNSNNKGRHDNLYKVSVKKKIKFSKFVYTKMYNKQVSENEKRLNFLGTTKDNIDKELRNLEK